MITFTELGSFGRLGNQLWQYAILKSVSIKTGKKIVLPNSTIQNVWHSQKCLLGNFNLRCEFVDYVMPKNTYQEVFPGVYDPSVYEVADDTNFFGYFQNYRYIEDIRDELIIDLSLKSQVIERVNQILEPLRKQYKKIVSVHFRRGDLMLPVHLSDSFFGVDGEMTNECELGQYINSATSRFDEDETLYYVVSGGARSSSVDNSFNDNSLDIDWCKKNFKRKNVIYSEGLEDIVEFAILNNVDANICGHDSTFGWWGAYLNPNQEVIAPRKSARSCPYNHPEYYPSNWTII